MQIRTAHPILSWIFSARSIEPTLIRQLILLFLYQPFPHTLGNDDLGHLVQATPNFFLTCDTFMIVTTPSVQDWQESSESEADLW